MSNVNRLSNDNESHEPDNPEPLPLLDKFAIQALPDDLVLIMYDGSEAGKSDEEIRTDVKAAKQKKLESN